MLQKEEQSSPQKTRHFGLFQCVYLKIKLDTIKISPFGV